MPHKASSTHPEADRSRRRYYKNPKATSAASHWRNVWSKYGITPQEYDALLAFQGNACAVCRRPRETFSKRFSTDHLHNKAFIQQHGKRASVRGLLCYMCNWRLLYRGVTPESLRRAADYLENWPARKVLTGLEDVPLG